MNIAIYTNILTPYRVHFFEGMYEECLSRGDSFRVLVMAATEPNRVWKYEDYKKEYTILLNSRTISHGEVHIHFNNNLEATLKRLNLDVLICAGGYLSPGIWRAVQLKKRMGFKMYFWSESHLHETRYYNGFKVKIREKIRNVIYKKFDGFWYAGKLSKEFIQTYCNFNAEMIFVPNLIDEAKYKEAVIFSEERKKQIRKKYEISENNVVIICPARLIPVKGIDKFIPILDKTQNKSKITMLLAGDGEMRENLEKMVKKTKLDVRFLGFQNQDSMIELYSISDVFVLPSISDANPLTCIEALWTELPLFISENCGNYPEVIEQGKNGYSFNYKNLNDAVKKLDCIISADKRWMENARNTSGLIAKEQYDTKRVIEKILNRFYEIK